MSHTVWNAIVLINISLFLSGIMPFDEDVKEFIQKRADRVDPSILSKMLEGGHFSSFRMANLWDSASECSRDVVVHHDVVVDEYVVAVEDLWNMAEEHNAWQCEHCRTKSCTTFSMSQSLHLLKMLASLGPSWTPWLPDPA